jgi:hypothetical protein
VWQLRGQGVNKTDGIEVGGARGGGGEGAIIARSSIMSPDRGEASAVDPAKRSGQARRREALSTTTKTVVAEARGSRPNVPSPAGPSPIGSAPKTPRDLYERIEASRDRLFFVAYPPDDHDLDDTNESKKKKKKKGGGDDDAMKSNWYLVRVDLDQCLDPELGLNCRQSGQYYVEFYAKASYDRGVLLAGYERENNVPGAKMRPRADSESRYWIEWHEYHYDKDGNHIVGKWKEFPPNSRKAMMQRFADFCDYRCGGNKDDDGDHGVADIVATPEFHPDFDRYLAQATILNLMNDRTRLVGPFDFDDDIMKSSPFYEEYLATCRDEESRGLFSANYSNLYVKDRVPIRRWEELLEAVKGRRIDPPEVVSEKRARMDEGQLSGKRAREVTRVPAALSPSSSGKRARGGPEEGPPCQESDKGTVDVGPLLIFPTTASQPQLQVRLSGGGRSHGQLIVSKEKMEEGISSVVEAAFARARQATSEDGEAFYVLGELKDALNEAIDGFVGGLETVSISSTTGRDVVLSEPLEGIDLAYFGEEEIDSFPVVFAYDNEDPDGISEKNAKIATLDHEVEERRLKRSSVNLSEEMKKVKSSKNKSSFNMIHPTLTEKESQTSAEVAEGLPSGWVVRQIPRGSGTDRVDFYWYSPEKHYKFRSKIEVRRFLEAMKTSDGDETVAIEKIKG